MTHVQTVFMVESLVTIAVVAKTHEVVPGKPWTWNIPKKTCFTTILLVPFDALKPKDSLFKKMLTVDPPAFFHSTYIHINAVQLIWERSAWSAALLNQQLPWTIQFPLDSPEARTQPQSGLVPCRCLRGHTTPEELLNLWPQSSGF